MYAHAHTLTPPTPKILKAQKHCTIAPISSGSIWPCAVMLPLPKAKNPAVSAQNVLTRTPWGAPTHSQRLENWNNSGSLVPFYIVFSFEIGSQQTSKPSYVVHIWEDSVHPSKKHSNSVAQNRLTVQIHMHTNRYATNWYSNQPRNPSTSLRFLELNSSFTGDTNCPINGTADGQHFAPGNTNQRPAHKP